MNQNSTKSTKVNKSAEVVNQSTEKSTNKQVSAQEHLSAIMGISIDKLAYQKDDTIGARFTNVLIAYLFDEVKFKSYVADLQAYIKNTYTKSYQLKADAPADRDFFKVDGKSMVVNHEIAPSIEQQINQRSEILEVLIPACEIVGAINRVNKVSEFLKKDIVQAWNKKAISIKAFETDYEAYAIMPEKSEKTKKAKSEKTRTIDDEFANLVSF